MQASRLVALDSSKVSLQKSNDQIILRSIQSVSPSYGDNQIIGPILWRRDKEAIKAGKELPSGFHHLCKGTNLMILKFLVTRLGTITIGVNDAYRMFDYAFPRIFCIPNNKSIWNTAPPSRKGDIKSGAVYLVRERRFISTWCKHPIEEQKNETTPRQTRTWTLQLLIGPIF